MIDNKQLRELIIKPALSKLQMYSTNAEEILVFTCASEFIKSLSVFRSGSYKYF